MRVSPDHSGDPGCSAAPNRIRGRLCGRFPRWRVVRPSRGTPTSGFVI